MKQLVVLSGKGGTGKTTVSASLAHLAAAEDKIVMVDADVDAPNLELLLQPDLPAGEAFYAGKLARIDQDLCIQCGQCKEVCRYEAVLEQDGEYSIDSVSCEGCAACLYVCPSEAISMDDTLSGYWYRSQTRFGELFHARLSAGAENSGKMVSTLRQEALSAAQEQESDWIIIDGAPGIGCPVIAAVTGVSYALVVSEPTVSGAHDLERALQICGHFRVPAAVCINKADINPQTTADIAAHCEVLGVPVLAEIPYDEVVIEAMEQGLAVTELGDNAVSTELRALWQALRTALADA